MFVTSHQVTVAVGAQKYYKYIFALVARQLKVDLAETMTTLQKVSIEWSAVFSIIKIGKPFFA